MPARLEETVTDPKDSRRREIGRRIRGNFDRGAGPYRAFEERYGFFRDLLQALLRRAPALTGRRVLDVGCGTGASLAHLARAVEPGGTAVGIDLSLGMLRQARAALGREAALVQLDGCHYAAALRGAFDAVVYNAVLFMLPDPAASLDSAHAVLRSAGGCVLISSLRAVEFDGAPIGEQLRELGYPAGRHAVAPWERVVPLLHERFAEVEAELWPVVLEADRFQAFYSLEPMSAGLLPGLPYEERLVAVQALTEQLRGTGGVVVQQWGLAGAQKPLETRRGGEVIR